MAEFLSLQEGKVYCPATSRLARWMESARNDFYEKIEKLVDPQRVETGTYLNDIVALWLPTEGLQVGHIVRIVRSPSLKSNFLVFEWRSDSKKSEKVTICFRGLNFEKKTSLGWEVAPATHTFNWCHVRSIIKVVGKVSGAQPKWPIYVYLTDIFKELPRPQEMDKERQKREGSQQKEENEKRKKGNPEDLSIWLLREILDEMGEPYCKSWKKGVLIEKVRAGREKANNTRCTASVRNTVTTGQERTIGHSSDSDSADSFTAKASVKSTSTSSSFRRVQRVVRQTQILYYFDEKKERLIHLLLLVLFIIDLLRAYMPNSLYVYVIYTLILIQATLVFEEIICFFSSFIALLMMLLTCSMFAQVNVRSFCGDQYPIDTFCAACH